MFERFTERARKVVVLAQDEARHFNHNYIGTEHLLLGLLREDEGVAAQALYSLNVALDEVREQVESIVGYGEEGTGAQAPFTPRSKKVLELALREALQLGHNYIGTEHILLGLVRESEGVAARVLSNLDVDPDKVRREVVRRLGGGRSRSRGGGEAGGRGVEAKRPKTRQLDQYGRNLTAYAEEDKLDPVIGRSQEIARIMQILVRRTKNNPVIIGEPGVGKTAIVEGLAEEIAEGKVPEILGDKEVYTLDLGARYISDRFLPDKAIDLVDEAASKMRIKTMSSPPYYKEIDEELAAVRSEKEAAIDGQEFEKAAREGKIEEKRVSIGENEIAEIVSMWTGIPVKKMTEEESARLLQMEDALHGRIVGQNEAIKAVSRSIRRPFAGIKAPNRPSGSFVFLGPTGVGKTELARTLAEYLFGNQDSMIRLDMSEYMERHTVSRLVGSPPGYVGYDVGAQHINKTKSLGFGSDDEGLSYKEMKGRVTSELRKIFRPELLNRIDET